MPNAPVAVVKEDGIGQAKRSRWWSLMITRWSLTDLRRIPCRRATSSSSSWVVSIAEAMALMEVHTPNVVLMDYHLPDGDGGQATKDIILRWPETKVLMISGSGGRPVGSGH